MKSSTDSWLFIINSVAPFTGAWIEISWSLVTDESGIIVAPFTGAWIEIAVQFWLTLIRLRVAPFTGAWIEMSAILPTTTTAAGSHPLRVRGLKCVYNLGCMLSVKSHPLRVRGLKCRHRPQRQLPLVVAPFTGAWIEIIPFKIHAPHLYLVAPFTGAWIEISNAINSRVGPLVAPFTGAWIEILNFSSLPSTL